jgi:hypothetical protein
MKDEPAPGESGRLTGYIGRARYFQESCLMLLHRKICQAECPLLALSGHKFECTDVCFYGRYWVQSGHDVLQRTCPLLTQSGYATLVSDETAKAIPRCNTPGPSHGKSSLSQEQIKLSPKSFRWASGIQSNEQRHQ